MIQIYPKSRIKRLSYETKQYVEVIDCKNPDPKKSYDLIAEQRIDEENQPYILIIGKKIEYKAKSKIGQEVIFIDTVSDKEKKGIEELVKQDEKFEGPIKFWEPRTKLP